MTTVSPALPALAAEDALRRRNLVRMKVAATSLLLAATLVFIVTRSLEDRWSWLGYVRATAEAAMVGALADWFAVTALLRHPLGLPIPHTAIIPNRKDQLGRGLGTFVQTNFLAPAVLSERLRSVGVAQRLGAWLGQPEHAHRLSSNAGALVRGLTEVMGDEDIQRTLETGILQRVRDVPAAPLMARVVEAAMSGRHHQALLDTTLNGLSGLLEENRWLLRQKLAEQSPWWLPEPIDDRLFKKFFAGVQGFLAEVAGDPDHELRHQLDIRVAELAVRLRTDPALIARGEQLKAELLEHPEVRAWLDSLWRNTKASILAVADDPDSDLRGRLDAALERAGRSLQEDPVLQAKVNGWIEKVVSYLAEEYGHEIADLIATTVARWDGAEASRRIELQVGRDLQFIRINGTVVGGLAGLAIYSIGQLL
jgi:uncharacterized membrane-anchored protein YjiN (DUF445 family)